ncbi:hypothetical protein BDP27DRAFT_1359330 [Rhodocollybia butyracea]|uniref:Uncharacterized protein n=1 Tax=Rhodocollybia butyracea TaxID=206335 RepID=A0A9P5Q4J0_9AGAR|nr:hypothetical protein BDP27DRAFT_1359330 [Rhodocollybia butyracea]
MRLRLQTATNTKSPLPALKAWFSFPNTDGDDRIEQSITGLKKSICGTIKSFASSNITYRELDLELDGFELLDGCIAEEILRDGDLVLVKKKQGYYGLGKRKAEDELNNKEKRLRPSKAQSPSPSSSSSESSPSSSSSSDSDSSSDSGSNNDPSSDSNSSESPSVASSKPKSKKFPLIPTKIRKNNHTVNEIHVPPGLGSTKTRRRNVRRRIKRKYDTVGANSSMVLVPSKLKRNSDADLTPLPSVPALVQKNVADTITDSHNMTMFSLGNKNKKRGYKYALTPATSQKKVFNVLEISETEEAEAESIPVEALDGPLPPSATIFTSAPSASQRPPRLIPPSELEALGKLPRNMFVTSVDVEEDLWDHPKKKGKKQRRHDLQQGQIYDAYGNAGDLEETEIHVALDYGGGSPAPVIASTSAGNEGLHPDTEHSTEEDTKSTLIWSVVETQFDAYPLVHDKVDGIQNGALVTWKALALNSRTFSPEVLLHIATVTATSTSSVSIRRLIRPGWEEHDIDDVEGTFSLQDIKELGWKFIDEVSR